jgi:4-amino-4-deoxy-L-arabinose transferase-like glycosyltransferase
LNAKPSYVTSWWLASFLIVFGVICISQPQATLLPLLDRDEPRFAEASREMLQSGHYIVPTFNQTPRYAKPPLIYWCQALSFRLFGENAFSARLPSLLAVAGTALILLFWGAKLGSLQIGVMAGLAYAFCVQTMQQGRVATADALLIFFMTLSGYAGWRLLAQIHSPKVDGSWNFWGVMLALAWGGGFLAKGPEALLPFIPILMAARGMGTRVSLSLTALLALGLLLVAAWAIPAYGETHGAYWREGLGHDVGDRMVTGFQGHGASTVGWYLLGLPLYFLLFWISALPWSPLLITHRRQLFAGRSCDWTERYLLWNAGLIFVIFSLMVTKLPHYTLPAFPFIALFFARRWMTAHLDPVLPRLIIGLFAGVMAILVLLFLPPILAAGHTPSPVGGLVRQAGDQLRSETKFALVDFREPNAIWEMRRIVASPATFVSEGDVIPYLREPGSRAVILSTALWDKLKAGADPAWKSYEARGFNAARVSSLDLTLVVKKA